MKTGAYSHYGVGYAPLCISTHLLSIGGKGVDFLTAERLLAYREKLLAKEADLSADLSAVEQEAEEALWSLLDALQGQAFQTAKGLTFSYAIKGNEMFVDRKDKSITRATVNLAFRTAMTLMREEKPISGPKKLGCFGASYLYPIFISIGLIEVPAGKPKGQLSF